MAIRTLIRENVRNLEIIIEKSDSDKLFFGVSREDPMTRESYTFYMGGKNPGRLTELFRESVVRLDDGREVYHHIEIDINNDKSLISYSSKSRTYNEQAHIEIYRAYGMVKMYRNKLQSDKDKAKLYPEVLDNVCKVVAFPSDVFKMKYRVVKR